MNNDSIPKTLFVTILLSLVCSVMVSGAAVLFKPMQEQNIALDVQRNILNISGLSTDAKSLRADEVAELYRLVRPKLVDLQSGKFIDKTPDGQTVDQFDQRNAAKDPRTSRQLSAAEDVAGIKRQSLIAKVYLIEEKGRIKTVVLQVHGYGLWSTMYGFMALQEDLNTVKGFGFFDQAETPGLGGEVDNPTWKAKWPGKKVYGSDGDVALRLVKGGVDANNPQSINQIDALAGATLTSNGVSNLLKFWLGEHGFKMFLTNLKEGRA